MGKLSQRVVHEMGAADHEPDGSPRTMKMEPVRDMLTVIGFVMGGGRLTLVRSDRRAAYFRSRSSRSYLKLCTLEYGALKDMAKHPVGKVRCQGQNFGLACCPSGSGSYN